MIGYKLTTYPEEILYLTMMLTQNNEQRLYYKLLMNYLVTEFHLKKVMQNLLTCGSSKMYGHYSVCPYKRILSRART